MNAWAGAAMTSEMRSVPVTARPMDKNTLLRKSMRILRLLEVLGNPEGFRCGLGMRATVVSGIQLVKRCIALRDFGMSMRGADDSPRAWGVWAPPLVGYVGGQTKELPPGRSVAPSSIRSARV